MSAESITLSVNVTVTSPIAGIADLHVTVALTNQGRASIQLNTVALQSPATALRMRDADLVMLKPGPPPVPPVDDGKAGRRQLGPDESITFHYRGRDYMAGRSVPPGRYEVMFRYRNTGDAYGDWVGTIESPWVGFEVRPDR